MMMKRSARCRYPVRCLVRQRSAANLAVMVADEQMPAPPQSLQWLLRRLCSQMLAPPQSLHRLLMRLCRQMLAPPQSLHLLLMRSCSQMLVRKHVA
jgi:hypothetical protein